MSKPQGHPSTQKSRSCREFAGSFLLIALLISGFAQASEKADAWIGVWGESQSGTSGYLQFESCGAGCDLLLKYYSSTDAQSRGCTGQDLPLKFASSTTAVAERKEYGGCRMTFTLGAKVVTAKQTGKGCSAYCTGEFLKDRYPFVRRELNLSYDFKRCERSRAFNVWCETKTLQDLEKAWTKKHDDVDSLRHWNTTSEGWAERDAMIAACDSQTDIDACIRRGYSALIAKLDLSSAKKVAASREKSLNDQTSQPNANFAAWMGEWSFDQDGYSGDLSVDACSAQGCHYSVTSGSKVSVCGSEGELKFSKEGAFHVQKLDDGVCRINFAKSQSAISVSSEGSCNSLCGVSGGGPDGEFKKKRARRNTISK